MSSIDNDFFVFKFTQNSLRVYEKHELKIFLKKFDFQVRVFRFFCTYISERTFKTVFVEGGWKACTIQKSVSNW